MKLINDSRFFEPPDVKEPILDVDGEEIEPLGKEEVRNMIGDIQFEMAQENGT